jgi:LysR family glycine cleavage system transcriptional activator
LEEVERDALELMTTGGAGGVLELGVLPTFAAKWLLPRLRGYLDAHPGVTVNLTPRTRPFLFEETELDATIYAGESGWPGTQAHFLMHESLIAVGSPALRAQALEQARSRRGAGPDAALVPGDLVSLPRLHISTRPRLWRQWFEHAGLEVRDALAGSRMELFSLIGEAAVQGLGVALMPRFLIEAELARGALVPLLTQELPSDRAYWLIVPQRKAEDPLVAGFRRWLLAQPGVGEALRAPPPAASA